MDSAAISVVGGFAGIIVGILGGHYLSGRRAKADAKRAYRERRLAPLVEYVNDLMTIVWKKRPDKVEKQESEALAKELVEILAKRMWVGVTSLKGLDKRLDDAMDKFLNSANQFTKVWDTEAEQSGRFHLSNTARELLTICDEIISE